MMYLLEASEWHQVGANIATMLGLIGIVILVIDHFNNRSTRNIQLMHRCIDIFRKWFEKPDRKVDVSYLELLNEELFYFQKRLIQKKVAVEWIEGMLDFIQVYGKNGVILNQYNEQVNLEALTDWQSRNFFFARIKWFIYPKLERNIVIPNINDKNHAKKKRELAKALYKHIKEYNY